MLKTVCIQAGDIFLSSHENLSERWVRKIQRVSVDTSGRILAFYRAVQAGGENSLDTVCTQAAFEEKFCADLYGAETAKRMCRKIPADELDSILNELRIDAKLLDATVSLEDEKK